MNQQQALESRFLELIANDPTPVDELSDLLGRMFRAGDQGTAESCLEMLLSEVSNRRDKSSALQLCLKTAPVFDPGESFSGLALRTLRRLFTQRNELAVLEASGLGRPPAEPSLRLMAQLLSLKPGDYCLDKNWGCGKLAGIDAFRKRMVIDFAERPSHAIPLTKAGESLQWLERDHVLARRQADPGAFTEWAGKHPEELVFAVIRDFGPLTPPRLGDLLARHKIIGEDEWKDFWAKARKGLKSNPRVIVPSRREDPLRLRLGTETVEEVDTFELAAEKNPENIISRVTALAGAHDGMATMTAESREVIGDRLAFALLGAGANDRLLTARLILLIDRLGLTGIATKDKWQTFTDPEVLSGVAVKLNVREVSAMVSRLFAMDPNAPMRLIEAIGQLPLSVIAAIIDLTEKPPWQDACDTAMGKALKRSVPAVALLAWGLRNRPRLQQRTAISPASLLTHAIAAIDSPLPGEGLRMQNIIRRYFAAGRDLEPAMREMTPLERETVFNRLKVSAGWDPLEQRSVMARMIKIFPELGRQVTAPGVNQPVENKPRLTSRRSYHDRRRQLRQLVDEEIPANSREIGQAREYGDLRENFEYHAARHQQGLLMQRKEQLEKDLSQVRADDFADAPLDRAGSGVTVVLASADGGQTSYSILGEWDSEPALGIISSQSRVAQMLMGKQAGSQVDLPDGQGGVNRMTIKAIEPLGREVRQWMEEQAG